MEEGFQNREKCQNEETQKGSGFIIVEVVEATLFRRQEMGPARREDVRKEKVKISDP